jgi:hypothetical protein
MSPRKRKTDHRYVVACNPFRRMIVGGNALEQMMVMGNPMPEHIEGMNMVKSLTDEQAKDIARKYFNARICELVEVKL